ncbi:hypothetical protein Tco_0441180 [Tanacetum coccineum]
MLLAMKDEAGSHLSNKENDFMLDNAYGEELLDELTASVTSRPELGLLGIGVVLAWLLSLALAMINKTLLKDGERRWLSDSQNELREFYKTDVIPTSRSLYMNLQNIKEELIEEVQEMLNIFESMEQRVNDKSPTETLLQKEIDRLLEVSLTSEIRDCVLLSVAKQTHDLLKDMYDLIISHNMN